MEDNFELNGLLNEYARVSEQMDTLKKQQDALKVNIYHILGKAPIEYDNGFLKAKVTNALTYKYPDEVSTIKTLKELEAAQFVEETINTRKLNDNIKKNVDSEITKKLLTENLAQPDVTVKLSVSRID